MIKAYRIRNEPVICPHMDERMGGNVNGPSLIRVPEWIKKPLGKFYLYFADHKGRYIRMAYADEFIGPWVMHEPGVMDVENSLFEPEDITPPPPEEQPEWAGQFMEDYLYAHIASPDVHIDHENQQIRMYYHGLLEDGDQQTRLANSQDGLNFGPQEPLLGPPYFRVFEYGDYIYAISWGGQLLRAGHWDGPFEKGPVLPDVTKSGNAERIFRHAAVLIRQDTLHVFFSCMGDTPEQILHVAIALSKNWENWKASSETAILKPELAWEGADLPIVKSRMGASPGRCHELRDPCIFEEDGEVYLLYCGAGEYGGIGLAKLEF